jgi:ABC-type polysaccharide/polyol phosphate export permease
MLPDIKILKSLYSLNPLTFPINAFRKVFYSDIKISYEDITINFVVILIITAIGKALYNALNKYFPEKI